MKKKLSVAMMFALILLVLGFSALAMKCDNCGATLRFSTDTRGCYPATCTKNGYAIFWCPNYDGDSDYYSECCDRSFDYIPALGHSYSWSVTKQPTCLSEGKRTGKCKRCGNTKTESVKKIPHDYVNWIVTREPTCVLEGNRHGTCSMCSGGTDEPIALIPHDYTSWSLTKKPTCMEKGKRTGICSMCGGTLIEYTDTIDHIWSERIITPASVNAKGTHELTCTMCQTAYTEEYAPGGTLEKGAKSVANEGTAYTVDTLQRALIDLGCLGGKADGSYGGKTEKAVAAFQEANGLNPDGVLWPETAEIILENAMACALTIDDTPDADSLEIYMYDELFGNDEETDGTVDDDALEVYMYDELFGDDDEAESAADDYDWSGHCCGDMDLDEDASLIFYDENNLAIWNGEELCDVMNWGDFATVVKGNGELELISIECDDETPVHPQKLRDLLTVAAEYTEGLDLTSDTKIVVTSESTCRVYSGDNVFELVLTEDVLTVYDADDRENIIPLTEEEDGDDADPDDAYDTEDDDICDDDEPEDADDTYDTEDADICDDDEPEDADDAYDTEDADICDDDEPEDADCEESDSEDIVDDHPGYDGDMIYCSECGTYVFAKVDWKQPTCKKDGKITFTCTDCGVVLASAQRPAFGHHRSEWEVTQTARCDRKGEMVRVCIICGDRETRRIDKLSHNYTDWQVITQLSDHSKEQRTGTCSMCGATSAIDRWPEGTLYRGIRNEKTAVRECQQLLKDQGWLSGKVDGDFGGKTEAAVRAFQTAAGLQADGIAWPQTITALRGNQGSATVAAAAGCAHEYDDDGICVRCGMMRNTCTEHRFTDGVCTVCHTLQVYNYCMPDARDASVIHYCPSHDALIRGLEVMVSGALTDADKSNYYSMARMTVSNAITQMCEERVGRMAERSATLLARRLEKMNIELAMEETVLRCQYAEVPFMVDKGIYESLLKRCAELCRVTYALDEVRAEIDETRSVEEHSRNTSR